MRVLFTLLFFSVFILLSPSANAQRTCYVDRGNEVCFPLGARSFADAVTRFDIGDPASKFATANVATTTLGEPDNDPRIEEKPELPQYSLTLGCGGTLTLQFRDNALVDVPGSDLYVFEIGSNVEPTHLSISTDGKNWIKVGTIKGGLAEVDISTATTPGEQYRFVRLQDAKKHCDGRWPGADIDAVGAIGSVPVSDGQLRVLAAASAAVTPAQIGLILDASGSMRGRLADGESKITAAKRVMRTLAAGLHNDAEVGLRIYGHRLPRRPKDKSCLDSELVVPFGPLERNRLIQAIDAVTPKGQTPIGRSLALLAKDFGDNPGFKLVVIVSDGIETCAPTADHTDYPPSVIRSMQARGIKFEVNVVGFDIESSETREFLRLIANTSGGRYFGARNAGELERAIRSSLELRYFVRNAAGKIVAKGTVGTGTVTIPAGRYTVMVLARPGIRITDVEVTDGMETRLTILEGGANPNIQQELVQQ